LVSVTSPLVDADERDRVAAEREAKADLRDGLADLRDRELLTDSVAARLQARLETMPVIEQAKGMIMDQEGCTAEQAFDLLRKASQSSNVPVRELAVLIVARSARRAGPAAVTIPLTTQPYSSGSPCVASRAAHRAARRCARLRSPCNWPGKQAVRLVHRVRGFGVASCHVRS
jgi:hypothetical protein